MTAPLASPSFDDFADAYARFRIGYAPELYDILEASGVRRGARVLDVGCGTGLVSHELDRRGCTMTGIDVSAPMLELARESVPHASFEAGRAEALPFARDAFDAAVSAQTFHWFDRTTALAELCRVVRPGGTIAVWWKGLMRGDTTRLIRDSVASELGLASPLDLLTAEFPEFENDLMVDRRLRVVPWIVQMTAERYFGYEFSRARARIAYGSRLEEYLVRLQERIGACDAELSISYVQLLYLGRVADRA